LTNFTLSGFDFGNILPDGDIGSNRYPSQDIILIAQLCFQASLGVETSLTLVTSLCQLITRVYAMAVSQALVKSLSFRLMSMRVDVMDTLTVERNNKPGASFVTKMLQCVILFFPSAVLTLRQI
jgi:hypothetical protein